MESWVLFLDELGEFPRKTLDMLRQPMESGIVDIARVKMSVKYPARFILISATNPCPCDYFGSHQRYCTCSPSQVRNYQLKASGPLNDRLDFILNLKSSGIQEEAQGETSALIRTRTTTARKQQLPEGGFQSAGSVNSESVSQVIIALASLGLDLDDKRFKKEKGDLLSALQSFVNKDGGISHTKGSESNYMATQQGLMALVAYDRLKTGKTGLYDMADVKESHPDPSFPDVKKGSFGEKEIQLLLQ
ncbi:ATP-binding protein [Bacillus cereus]|uniref:ATP-binding protein n=1 Tax=Bacillus cereus TaxID=1396 RepID=UPI002DDB9A8F|nr:ATP-binding protein [Bacillus cereus]